MEKHFVAACAVNVCASLKLLLIFFCCTGLQRHSFLERGNDISFRPLGFFDLLSGI